MSKCWLDVPTCADVGGLWNKEAGFCGSQLSAGKTILKPQLNPLTAKTYTDKYATECKDISMYDYLKFQENEKKKFQDASNRLTVEKSAKQNVADMIENERNNIAALSTQLAQLQVSLDVNRQNACHPTYVCLKAIDGRKIPISQKCDQATIQKLLAKPVMSPADVQTILNIVKSTASSSYGIQQHPDFVKYIAASNVQKCP